MTTENPFTDNGHSYDGNPALLWADGYDAGRADAIAELRRRAEAVPELLPLVIDLQGT